MLFKIAGFLIVFMVCSFSGMYKSACLRKRAEKLSVFFRAVDDMSERIRAQACEAESLIAACFEKDLVYIRDSKIGFNSNFLEKSDINLLREFFENFGMRDIDGEYERTKFYVKLLQKQCDEANGRCNKLCRLYNTVGILSGVFLCIFLL